MEVPSSTIPATGVSLLFTTALQIFDGVRSAAQFSAADEVLRVKIELEKVRLIIWGQSIGLDGSPEQRDDALNLALGEEYLRTAVLGLLACFNNLFEDSEKLKDRYGLVQRANRGAGYSLYQLLGSTFSGTYNRYRGYLLEGSKDFEMLWAVSDEKLLRGLVEELKAINSSLNHMLPIIRNQTRVRLRTDIMRSTDVGELQSLVKASDDINDLVSETASLRLEILSGALESSQPGPIAPSNKVPASRPVSMIQPKPTEKTSNPGAALVPNSPALDAPAATTKQTTAAPVPAALPAVKSERLSMRAGPPYDNTGALVIQKLASGAQIPSFQLWRANVEDPGQPAQKPESNVMDGIHIPSNLLPWCQRLLEVDPEGDPRYPGWAPASVSLEGLSREYLFMRLEEVDDADTPPKKWVRACGTPGALFDDLVDRWAEIAADGGLGPRWTEEIGHQQVKNLVGPSEVVWLDPGEGVKIRHQISDILGPLGEEDIFLSFEKNSGSVAAVALRNQVDPSTTYTLADFLNQLLHAKELTLRLERDKGRWHGGITREIIYNMIVADLWMRNLEIKDNDGTFEFLVRMDVRRRQVDAMLSFAETMKWPFLAEARKTLNDFVQHGTRVDLRTWDWVAGLALPGSMFPTALMFGLHQACTSLNKTAPAGTVQTRHANFGFIFTQVSYWRSRSIVGKVLAVVPDLHEIGGWVGPCMPPTGLETYPTPGALVKVFTHSADMNLKDYAGGDPPYVPSDGRMNWEDAVFPPASEEICVLRGLHMDPVPTEELNPDIDDSVTAYRAKLDFFLPKANKTASFTLYTNSFFVAAPPCHGTHKVDPKYTELYTRTIYEVSELDALEIKVNEIAVINATGHGAQAVARAWCSEQGTNAVVLNRDKGCCFKCGLMVAGKEGVDVDVLILC